MNEVFIIRDRAVEKHTQHLAILHVLLVYITDSFYCKPLIISHPLLKTLGNNPAPPNLILSDDFVANAPQFMEGFSEYFSRDITRKYAKNIAYETLFM